MIDFTAMRTSITILINRCIGTLNYADVHKQIKMVSDSIVMLMKNGSGKSPVWQYFGFCKSPNGVIQREKAICRLSHSELPYSGNTTNI